MVDVMALVIKENPGLFGSAPVSIKTTFFSLVSAKDPNGNRIEKIRKTARATLKVLVIHALFTNGFARLVFVN